jgi:hypothetical protein
MRAAADLHAEITDLDHPYVIPIFLAEEGYRAYQQGVVE